MLNLTFYTGSLLSGKTALKFIAFQEIKSIIGNKLNYKIFRIESTKIGTPLNEGVPIDFLFH